MRCAQASRFALFARLIFTPATPPFAFFFVARPFRSTDHPTFPAAKDAIAQQRECATARPTDYADMMPLPLIFTLAEFSPQIFAAAIAIFSSHMLRCRFLRQDHRSSGAQRAVRQAA